MGDARVVFIEETNHACAEALRSTHTSACVNACDTYTHAHMDAPMYVAPTYIGFACMRQG